MTNNREMYEAWKRAERAIQPDPLFVGRVMARVRQAENDKHHGRPALMGYVERFTASPWARAGAIAAAALVGAVRLAVVLRIIL